MYLCVPYRMGRGDACTCVCSIGWVGLCMYLCVPYRMGRDACTCVSSIGWVATCVSPIG